MNESDKRLSQFVGCYLHEDWNMDGAKSWKDVVARYVRENSRAQVAFTCSYVSAS